MHAMSFAQSAAMSDLNMPCLDMLFELFINMLFVLLMDVFLKRKRKKIRQ